MAKTGETNKSHLASATSSDANVVDDLFDANGKKNVEED